MWIWRLVGFICFIQIVTCHGCTNGSGGSGQGSGEGGSCDDGVVDTYWDNKGRKSNSLDR